MVYIRYVWQFETMMMVCILIVRKNSHFRKIHSAWDDDSVDDNGLSTAAYFDKFLVHDYIDTRGEISRQLGHCMKMLNINTETKKHTDIQKQRKVLQISSLYIYTEKMT